MPKGEGAGCGLWDLRPIPGSAAWWRCAVCQLTFNEHTNEVVESGWRVVRWPEAS